MSISLAKRKARLQNLVNGQEKVITLLNKISQLHSDMDVVEFIEMYQGTKNELNRSESDVTESWAFTNERQDFKLKKQSSNIESNFNEDMMNDMFNEMSDMSEY